MRHFDHTHETAAEARACDARRSEASARLLRQHTGSAIMANLTGREYRPITPQAAQRQDAKFARMNRTAPRAQAVASRTATRGTTPAYVSAPATDKQLGFARKLLDEKNATLISMAANDVMMDLIAGNLISKQEASLLIDDLLAAPRKARDEDAAERADAVAQPQRHTGPSLRDLAATLPDKGYYALRTPGSEDEIHYYRITRSERGYVKVQEKAGPDLYPVDYRRSLAIVEAIAQNPATIEAAQFLFADTLECCYRCGRDLTDATSRALRIGPDCRTK